MFEYAVKYVCGKSGSGGIVARGAYYTAINIHNPLRDQVKVISKVASAGESTGEGGAVSDFISHELKPDQVLELDCNAIRRMYGSSVPTPFSTGFLVVQSETELDVVAVYTVAGLFGRVKSIDVERVAARVLQAG